MVVQSDIPFQLDQFIQYDVMSHSFVNSTLHDSLGSGSEPTCHWKLLPTMLFLIEPKNFQLFDNKYLFLLFGNKLFNCFHFISYGKFCLKAFFSW